MSSEKKNILIVHNYYQIPGGEDTVVANEKTMLEKHGHKVILYSRNNAELKQMSKIRIKKEISLDGKKDIIVDKFTFDEVSKG